MHFAFCGAEFPFLLKRARISIRDLKARYPGTMILVAVEWSGKELVGKKGIEGMLSWPFDAPDGDHHVRLMDEVQAELVGFAADCHRYAVHSAARSFRLFIG